MLQRYLLKIVAGVFYQPGMEWTDCWYNGESLKNKHVTNMVRRKIAVGALFLTRKMTH